MTDAAPDVAPAAPSIPDGASPNPAMATGAPPAESPASIYDAVSGLESAPPATDAQSAPATPDPNRPEFLLDKYTSIEDQAKAYPELLKQFGDFKGAPENYDLTALPEHLNKESPLIKGMAEFFKKKNLSQEGFVEAINVYAKLAEEFSEVKPQEIMQELGAQANEIVGRVGNWIKNNFSPEEQAVMKSWSISAKDIQLLDKLRASSPLSRAPTTNDFQGHYGFETLKAVEAEKAQNWDRYRNDPAYAAEISRRYQDAAMREGHQQESFAEMKRRG